MLRPKVETMAGYCGRRPHECGINGVTVVPQLPIFRRRRVPIGGSVELASCVRRRATHVPYDRAPVRGQNTSVVSGWGWMTSNHQNR